MKSIFKDKDKNSLIITDEIEEGTCLARTDFREKMVRNNHIKGLLEFSVNIVDREKIYEYDTAGMVTLEYVSLHEELSCDRIKSILLGIVDIVIRGAKYMLDEKDYIMDPAYIFFDTKGDPHLAYHTGYGQPLRKQLENLSEYLMNRIDYHDQKAVLMVYTIYMRSREEGFGVYELKEYIESGGDKISEQRPKAGDDNEYIRPGPGLTAFKEEPFFEKKGGFEPEYEGGNDSITEQYSGSDNTGKVKTTAYDKYFKYLKPALMIVLPVMLVLVAWKLGLLVKPEGKIDVLKVGAVAALGLVAGWYICKKIPEGKLTGRTEKDIPEKSRVYDAGSDEATELLSEITGTGYSKPADIVLVSDSYPDININSFPFYIGKDEAHMDYCLNATGVSRYHMKVDCIDGDIYIADLNSTNGVYLNGTRISVNRPVKICKGDHIKIGLCEYVYH